MLDTKSIEYVNKTVINYFKIMSALYFQVKDVKNKKGVLKV